MPIKWLSKEKSITLLSKEMYGRVATCSKDGQPYITPINFVVDHEKIYFHTGFTGRKLENIKDNPKVCFEVSRSGKMYPTPYARDFTMRFWSILVFGKAQIIQEKEAKLTILNLIMDKYAQQYKYQALALKDMDIVNVIEISIDEITGKVSLDPKEL